MLESLLDTYGEAVVLAAAGFIVGLIFGAGAQRSRFCLRAATVEVFEGRPAGRMAIWLVVFFSALTLTQAAGLTGFLDTGMSRQISGRGSMSGAVIGGLMFGTGMILARGCASRLLVLSGTGNMRALITGLVVTLVAQASYTGVLAPVREALAGLWTVEGGATRDLGLILGFSPPVILAIGTIGVVAAVVFAHTQKLTPIEIVSALAVGFAVSLGWVLTYLIATTSFEVVGVSSVTFTGPATDTLMTLVTQPKVVLSFGVGLVPGVFVASALTSIATGTFQLQRFGADTPMERYLIGAVLMGFGAMLAGGCAVGAGVSGGAVLSLTAWVAVACMWIGAIVTQVVIGWTKRPGAAAGASGITPPARPSAS